MCEYEWSLHAVQRLSLVEPWRALLHPVIVPDVEWWAATRIEVRNLENLPRIFDREYHCPATFKRRSLLKIDSMTQIARELSCDTQTTDSVNFDSWVRLPEREMTFLYRQRGWYGRAMSQAVRCP